MLNMWRHYIQYARLCLHHSGLIVVTGHVAGTLGNTHTSVGLSNRVCQLDVVDHVLCFDDTDCDHLSFWVSFGPEHFL